MPCFHIAPLFSSTSDSRHGSVPRVSFRADRISFCRQSELDKQKNADQVDSAVQLKMKDGGVPTKEEAE